MSDRMVRPFAMVGRGRAGTELLPIEALVRTNGAGVAARPQLKWETRQVVDLCVDDVRSVAEVSALLCVPLSVARLLVGEVRARGLVDVHTTGGGGSPTAFLEEVLDAFRAL